MRSVFLVLLGAIVLANLVSANWMDTLEERMIEEQIQELAQREVDDDDDEYRRVYERNNKDYLTAKKHPQRLRDCVVCVGKQREKGLNVKQATAHCNKVCKRSIFETRSFEDDFSDN